LSPHPVCHSNTLHHPKHPQRGQDDRHGYTYRQPYHRYR